jgi:hypothetical protein
MEIALPGLPVGGDVATYAAVERLLDGDFYLRSDRGACATLGAAERQTSELVRRARSLARAERIAGRWGEDGPALLRVVLDEICGRLAYAGALHERLLGRAGLGRVDCRPEFLQLMVERRLLGVDEAGRLVEAVGRALAELTEVPVAQELLHEARGHAARRGPDGGVDAVRALLALLDGAAEVQLAYMNLLLVRTAMSAQQVAVRLVRGLPRATGLARAMLDWAIGGAPETGTDRVYLAGAAREVAVLAEVALAASFAAARRADSSDDVHDALCRLLGVARLRVDAEGLPGVPQRAELAAGLRGARQRGTYARLRPARVRGACAAAAGLRIVATDPLARLLRARLLAHAHAAIETGECAAPQSVVLAEPFCRAVDRLVRVAALYESVA